MEVTTIKCDHCEKEVTPMVSKYFELRVKQLNVFDKRYQYCCLECLKAACEEALASVNELTNPN